MFHRKLVGGMIMGWGLLMWVLPVSAATFVVDTVADIAGNDVPGQRSLRWAINQSNANGNAEADLIRFSLPVGSPILPTSGLPTLTAGKCTIKGDKNGDNVPDIILDGSSLSGNNGLVITSADNVIWGLVIIRFPYDGVYIGGTGAQRNRVRTCYIGIDATGTVDLGNGNYGVSIDAGAKNNVVGGDTAAYRNVISGNDDRGVYIRGAGTEGNKVRGNYIGLNKAGDGAVGNTYGVVIEGGAKSNTIGGAAEGQRNVVSGNNYKGVTIGGSGTDGNVVIGNYVGTDASGTVAIPNTYPWYRGAVEINGGAQRNRIGGKTPGERNVVSGNQGVGVMIRDLNTRWNKVQGNYIGTDATGTAALANGYEGIMIRWNDCNNSIGGLAPGERNVISGNGRDGVAIFDSPRAKYSQVIGNYIGTDVTGTVAVPNGGHGVHLPDASFHTVGPGNVISGNGQHGVMIEGHINRNNVVKGNYIGTDKDGTGALGNGRSGVRIEHGVKYARVGGNTAADRNVISGNAWEGVAVGRHVSDNKVQGNYIGTDKTGTFAIPNGVNGVTLWDMAERTTIGGTQPGQGNVISGNREHGIHIVDGGTDDNLIQGNYIGTDATGLLPLGNVRDGIRIGDGGVPQRNLIGGPTANARNVISANGEYGVMIGWSSDSNTVQGNYIGTDKTGTADLGNTLSGVYVDGDCWFTTLADNVISGNDQYGIGSGGGSFSQIVGNYIGTAQDGILPLANGGDGIHLSDAGNDIQIGGSGTADRNIIAGNLGHGVYVNIDWNTLQGNFIGADVNGASLGNTGSGVYFDAGANDNLCQENLIIDNLDDGLTVKGWRNRLTRNSTYGNDDLGIDFWADGVTDPNPLKIDSITSNGDGTYTINGTAPANSTVEVFLADGDPSGYGEGPEFLAETTAAGDGSWSAVITADAGDPITATAYPHPSQRYNTSEFCANVNVPSG